MTLRFAKASRKCLPGLCAVKGRAPLRFLFHWRFHSKDRRVSSLTEMARGAIPGAGKALADRLPCPFVCVRKMFRGLRKRCRLIFRREGCGFAVGANMPQGIC